MNQEVIHCNITTLQLVALYGFSRGSCPHSDWIKSLDFTFAVMKFDPLE